MANHKSAKKRAIQNEKRRMRNKAVKTRIKNVIKEVRAAISAGDPQAAQKTLNAAKSVIDKGASKGVIHKKTASRKISRLARGISKIQPGA